MGDDSDFMVLKPSKHSDPDGSKLAVSIRATQALEHARSRRDALVRLLAAAGIPVWLVLAWGGAATASRMRSFSLALWAAALLAVVVALVSEWRCYKRRAF